MNPWSLRCESSKAGRTYTRPLGITEQVFYWDGKFDGTADSLHHAAIEANNQKNGGIFTFENTGRAWIRLKHRFPLLGANLERQCDDRQQIIFVINDINLGQINPGELELFHISSDQEVEEFKDQLVNGRRCLSNHLLARLFILVRDAQHHHILFYASHCITDGMSNLLLIRSLLEELTSPSDQNISRLEERLALTIASEDLMPATKRSQSRQRWHRAMGHVIWLLRMGKLVGGHTLPRTYSALTKFTPATSGVIGYSFTEVESAIIVETCKKLGFTFGNALPVLGQVSLTRLLCRWYTQGKISVEEWEFRKKEPMPTAGPLNLRPFLDRGWHDSGGANNICLNIGFFFYRLPFMPLGAASRISPGDRVPSYSELLSPGRFSLRSKSLRKQATQYIYHPLFGEIGSARMPKRLKSGREIALTWAEERSRCHNVAPIPASEQSGGGFVISHGGSSLGNIDNLVPQMYNGPRAKIKVKTLRTVLNCRPAELYLGSSTFDKQLNMSVYWDKNVYDEATVVEWLADIVEATQHYLGGDKDAKL